MDRNVWTKFKKICEENGTNASQQIVSYVETEVARIEETTPKPQQPLVPTLTTKEYIAWLNERVLELERQAKNRDEFYKETIIDKFGAYLQETRKRVRIHERAIQGNNLGIRVLMSLLAEMPTEALLEEALADGLIEEDAYQAIQNARSTVNQILQNSKKQE
jgi:hypothetical protein